jgi:hypothetical protein
LQPSGSPVSGVRGWRGGKKAFGREMLIPKRWVMLMTLRFIYQKIQLFLYILVSDFSSQFTAL